MGMMTKLKALFGAQDMTVGKPMNALIKFSVPLLIGNLAQQLYNTADSIIVGKYVGDTALASVGTAGPIFNLMLVLFMGVSTGASILTAQLYGAKDRERLTREVGTTITLTFLTSMVITLMGCLLSPWLIGLLNAPADVAEGAVTYLTIMFIGMFGCSLYNIIGGVLRGMGDSITPLLFLILATMLNIALDLLFVRNFAMGVAGVAWATIIAQAISGVLCLIRLWRMRSQIDIAPRHLIPDMQLMRKLCALGLPAGITQAIFSMATIMVQSLINGMGTAVIAANVAVMRVDGFAMMPNFTFGTAATTFVGQNVGARRPDRITRGTRDMLVLALSFAVVVVLAILLMGGTLLGMFTNTEEVISIGTTALRWLALGYVCFSVTQVLQGTMRGYGETAIPMYISIITTVLLRMPLAFLLVNMTRSEAFPGGDPNVIFASLLFAWVMGMIITIAFYRYGTWRKKLGFGAGDAGKA